MRIFKCEVCGEDFEDHTAVKRIDIRRYKNMVDIKPVLVRYHDVCNECIVKIFGEEKNDQVFNRQK